MQERLQKALAAAGIGSRRACETWIEAGRVRVDGEVVTQLGTKVDLATQRVTFDGHPVRLPQKHYYIALNKPRGVVCTLADRHAARVVTELVDIQGKPLLRPVGRLDADSEGLLFLTDDGDFLYKLTHPKHHVPKTYRASVRGVPDGAALELLARGVRLEDGVTAPAENVRVRSSVRGKTVGEIGHAEIELTIYEGRNRQVRRMLSAVGYPVTRLVRVRIGQVRLTELPSGAWRHLTAKEISLLTQEADADSSTAGGRKTPSPRGRRADPTPSEEGRTGEVPRSNNTQENTSWHTPPPLTRPRASSSPNSSRKTRPSRPRTSSRSPRKASTTD